MNVEEKYPLFIGHSLAGRTRLRCIQEVANFICIHGQYGGLYIDKIADMEYREELLKVLIPMQQELDGTNEEFAEEQAEEIDEAQSPIMGM